MKERFTIDDQGELVNREGVSLGKIVALTLERRGGTIGGGGESFTNAIEKSALDNRVRLPPAPSDDVASLWESYLAMRDRSPKKIRRRTLDQQTKKMIERALVVGETQEWLAAVPAILNSPHHLGQNDRQKLYLEPRHVFTACTHGSIRGHLDWLLDLGPQTAGIGADGAPISSVVAARISEAKRRVLEAFDMAGSAEAQKIGDESERFLAEHGWHVDHSNGRPQFTASSPHGQDFPAVGREETNPTGGTK